MKRLRKDLNYWTKERCSAEAKKYKTRTEFGLRSGSAYQAAYENSWLDEICGHMKEIRKKNGHWTKERCAAEAKKYKTKSDFFKSCQSAHSAAYSNGWLDEICSHMIVLRKHRSKSECRAEAIKYKTKKEFREKSPKEYASAKRYFWMNEICIHMKK